MNTLTIILIVLTVVLLIANIVMFTIERKTKPTTPNRKSKAIVADDVETLLIKTEMIINSLSVISVEYQKIDDDMYMMSFVYTEILDDLKINNYYRLYKGVEKTLDELNPEKRMLIEDRYWGEHSWKNWKEYAESINYSVRSAYRLRDEVLAIFAEKIGEF
ncbi:hypothetical protein [Enterococcus cecorum]|uniref:hypothetical protein n=1 Tax=Enterococcus cecorum TaxID=44008 RepID=UPI00148BE1FA|nr:hypothetical protein [Enterococcus cecorum]